MEKRYKVLTSDLRSPYQGIQYELGKWYEEPRTGEPGENGCVRGLYAGPIESLIYRGVWRDNEHVYECEVAGKQAGEPPLKECWERLRIVRRVDEEEVRQLAHAEHERLGWLLEEALYPVHPLRIQRSGDVTEHEKELLRQWASVVASVKYSVFNSVWYSVLSSVLPSLVWDSMKCSVMDAVLDYVWNPVRCSVENSMWDSVSDSMLSSVWNSMWAYIGSLFPCVRQWKYIDHAPGEYPFQSGADLWRAGLVPSFDGKTWRLHAGPNAEVVYTMDII